MALLLEKAELCFDATRGLTSGEVVQTIEGLGYSCQVCRRDMQEICKRYARYAGLERHNAFSLGGLKMLDMTLGESL